MSGRMTALCDLASKYGPKSRWAVQNVAAATSVISPLPLFSAPAATGPSRSVLLHHALQRMLVFACEVHHLRHLGLGDLVGEDPAFPYAVVVNVQHDARGVVLALAEEAHQHVHHELHGRVVVIQEEDTIEVRPFGLRPRLGNDGRAAP